MIYSLSVSSLNAVGFNVAHNRFIDGDQVSIAKSEDSIQVHMRAIPGQFGDYHPFSSTSCEKITGQLANGLGSRALSHTNQYRFVADRHYISPFDAGLAMILVDTSIPDLKFLVLEIWMEFVDRCDVQGFLAASWPVHGVQRHTVIDPATGIACKHLIG